MYSVLHSHLTAVAIDFFKVHIGTPGPPIAERGGVENCHYQAKDSNSHMYKIPNEKRINSNNLFLRVEACLKSFGGKPLCMSFSTALAHCPLLHGSA